MSEPKWPTEAMIEAGAKSYWQVPDTWSYYHDIRENVKAIYLAMEEARTQEQIAEWIMKMGPMFELRPIEWLEDASEFPG